MLNQFTFSNAILHFARTDGPGGYIWKYIAVSLIAYSLIAYAAYMVMQPVLAVFSEMFLAVINDVYVNTRAYESQLEMLIVDNIWRILFGYLGLLVLSVIVWSMFEASIQRRYIRDEGFSLRFGGDELRLIVVGLIWILLSIFANIIIELASLGLIMPVAQMIGDPNIALAWATVVSIALWGGWYFLVIRWSAAAALTIRDRKITFFDSWTATRSCFWQMLGAYIVLFILFAVMTFVLYGLVLGGFIGALASAPGVLQGEDLDPAAALDFLMQPGVFTAGAITFAAFAGLYAISGYVWAGVAALAAKTDPRGGGLVSAPDAFS